VDHRRYYIGQPGQQFKVRADWSALIAADQHKSKWVVSCEVDGSSVGEDTDAGRTPGGQRTDTHYVFESAVKEDVEYRLAFGATKVENQTAEAVAEEVQESDCGHVRVVVQERKDVAGYYTPCKHKPAPAPASAASSVASPAATGSSAASAEQQLGSAILLPATTKFWRAPGLSLAYSVPVNIAPVKKEKETYAAPAAEKKKVKHLESAAVKRERAAYMPQAPAKKKQRADRVRKYKYGRVVAEESVYYDTAELLAIRLILPKQHSCYPRQYMEEYKETQRAKQALRATRRQTASAGVEKLRALLEDPDIRASVPASVLDPVNRFVANDGVKLECNLAGDDDAEVWSESNMERPVQQKEVKAIG